MTESRAVFIAAVLACVQTGVTASIISDYCTMWLLMRVLYLVVSFAAMGKYIAIGAMRTPIWLTSIAVLAKMLLLAQAAHEATPAKRGFF